MKINKLILDNYDVIQTTNDVKFIDKITNEETEIKKIVKMRIEQSIMTHTNIKGIRNIKNFLDNNISLGNFLEQILNNECEKEICNNVYYKNWSGDKKDKILFNKFEMSVNLFDEYNKICNIVNQQNKSLEPYEKFYIPEILNYLQKKLGKNFLLYVGNIFYNQNKNIDEINKKNNCYLNVLTNSIKSNVVKINSGVNIESKNKLEDLVFNYEDIKFELNDLINKLKQFENLEINKNVNIKKTQRKRNDKNYNEKVDAIFKQLSNCIFKYFKELQANINFDDSNSKNRFGQIVKKLSKLISDDLRFEWNNNTTFDQQLVNKIVNKKINILKKNHYNFVAIEHFYASENNVYSKEQKIIAHTLFKLYRNLAVSVGHNILNYNNQTSKLFQDFGCSVEKFDINNFENNFNDKEFKKEYWKNYINSMMLVRNFIFHQKPFGKIQNKSDFDEKIYLQNFDDINILNKINEIYIKQMNETFVNHNIKIDSKANLKIEQWNEINISLQFKRVFKKIIKNEKHDEIINWCKYIFENQNENTLAEKYLLKLLFNNNFQKWLNDDNNKVDVKVFTSWYKNYSNIKKTVDKLKFPIKNGDNYKQAFSAFGDYVSKGTSDDTLDKRKSLSDYFGMFAFLEFLKENNISKTDITKKVVHFKYDDIEDNDKIIQIFLTTCLNLTNEELDYQNKILKNFRDRIFKNYKIEQEYNKNYLNYWYFNEKNINLIHSYINKLMFINQSNNEYTSISLNNIFKSYNEIVDKNSQNNNVSIIEGYAKNTLFINVLEKLNNDWKSLGFETLSLENKSSNKKNKNDPKSYIEISKKRNFENGQAIINGLKLIKQINAWTVRWVMYREFYNYAILKNLKSILKKEKNSKDKNYLHSIIAEYNTEIDNLGLYGIKDKIEEFKITYDKTNNNKTKIREIINNKLNFINKHTTKEEQKGALSQFMHFEKQKNNTYLNINSLESLINELRKVHSISRNNKNMILPSLNKILEKHKLNIEYTFTNHEVIKYQLLVKNIEIDKNTIDLLSENELKIYNLLLNYYFEENTVKSV